MRYEHRKGGALTSSNFRVKPPCSHGPCLTCVLGRKMWKGQENGAFWPADLGDTRAGSLWASGQATLSQTWLHSTHAWPCQYCFLGFFLHKRPQQHMLILRLWSKREVPSSLSTCLAEMIPPHNGVFKHWGWSVNDFS